MATTYFKPTSAFDQKAFDVAKTDADRAHQAWLDSQGRLTKGLAEARANRTGQPGVNTDKLFADTNALATASNTAKRTAAGLARDEAGEVWDSAQGMTAGVSDSLMNDPRIEAALGQLQKGMSEGPYSEAVQNQMISRNADSSAYAEGVNADELRNQLAARGIGANDPGYQSALREMQQGRQAGNLAFAGDTRSNATLQNYGAQQAAAQALAGTRLNQYNSAAPGYSQAANMQANRQFAGNRVAFTGNSGGGTAPAQGVDNSGPGQMAFGSSTPRVTTGGNQTSTTPKPAVTPTTAANSTPTPGTQAYTAWYQARYGAKAQPGMTGAGRDAQGNLISPTQMAPATGGSYVTPKTTGGTAFSNVATLPRAGQPIRPIQY